MMIVMYGSFLDVSWSSCVCMGIRHFAVERRSKHCSGYRHWAHCVVGSRQWVLLTLHIRWLALNPVAAPVSLLVPIMQLVWVIYSYECIELVCFGFFSFLRGNGLCRSWDGFSSLKSCSLYPPPTHTLYIFSNKLILLFKCRSKLWKKTVKLSQRCLQAKRVKCNLEGVCSCTIFF